MASQPETGNQGLGTRDWEPETAGDWEPGNQRNQGKDRLGTRRKENEYAIASQNSWELYLSGLLPT